MMPILLSAVGRYVRFLFSNFVCFPRGERGLPAAWIISYGGVILVSFRYPY